MNWNVALQKKHCTDNMTTKSFRCKNQEVNKDLMEGIRMHALMIEKLTFLECLTLNEHSLGHMGVAIPIVTIR